MFKDADSAEVSYSSQGALNKNEIQMNLCKIFSILMFNEFYW